MIIIVKYYIYKSKLLGVEVINGKIPALFEDYYKIEYEMAKSSQTWEPFLRTWDVYNTFRNQ